MDCAFWFGANATFDTSTHLLHDNLAQRTCPSGYSKSGKVRIKRKLPVCVALLFSMATFIPFIRAVFFLFFSSSLTHTSAHLVTTIITHRHYQPTIRLLDVTHFWLFWIVLLSFPVVHYNNNHRSSCFCYWLDALFFWEIISCLQ